MAGCQQDSVEPTAFAVAGNGQVQAPIGGEAGASMTSAGMGAAAGSGGSTSGASGVSGAGTGGTPPANVDGGVGGAAGTDEAAGTGGAGGAGPVGGACDLSGRWIATLHMVTDAIGQQQTTHFFTYYEIAPEGDGFVVTKGLHCGDDAEADGDFAVQGNFEGSWPAARMLISYAGRTVTSTQGGSGCDVHFGKAYTVRGATVAHYRDNPSAPMPTVAQQATATTPGWEDWDNDGQPGITGRLSGPVVTGRVFVAPRHWTELTGTVPSTMTSFQLPIDWQQEPNVMAFDPPDNFLLGSSANRHPDSSLHFGEFARLADGQATGDDNAICDAVIELVPTLTPAAGAI